MASRSRSFLNFSVLLLGLASCTAASLSSAPRACPSDPFADPKNDPCNPLKYIASNALTGVAFGLVMLVALTQTFMAWRQGGRWMSSMIVGEYCFALGLGTRFGLNMMPESRGLYIVEYMFVVLSPCAFIAADYVLLGRLARHVSCDDYLMISPRRITIVFVSSDITTFLVQGAGGGISSSANDVKSVKLGSHIFLAGIALQLASFFVFTCVYLVFLYRVRTRSPAAWTMDQGKPWYRDWRSLAGALLVSCVGILIRSVYRTLELSQGFSGHLATVEAFFYGLDTLPLFLSIAIYVPFWPGRFIPNALPPPAAPVEKDILLRQLGGTPSGSLEAGKV
ncbi:hypothetical protein PLICRDRAFT_96258 [Plicaturopsis crispa FD-325 SS-3]|nr:hypothetical protein PLICRDRAFT_96258 [Plicaturopsis crispa FD-325 SS-3]